MAGSLAALVLTAEAFHPAVSQHDHLVCLLHRGQAEAAEAELAALIGGDAGPWTWCRLDLDRDPEVGAIFALEGPGPFLIVMRKRIGLYCEPLGEKPAALTRALIDRAAALDMTQVEAEVRQSRLGEDLLAGRRACPTSWLPR